MDTLQVLLERELRDVGDDVLRILRKRTPDLLSLTVPTDERGWVRPPWDHHPRWDASHEPWLLRFLERAAPFLVERFVQVGGLLPAPEERVLARLGLAATSGEGQVFLLDGNVRDLLFDGHIGYAPLDCVLEHHWIHGGVLGTHYNRAFLRCSLSAGLEPGKRTALEYAGGELDVALRAHKNEVKNQLPEARLGRDLAFLDGVRRNDAMPHTLVLFERATLAFPADSRGTSGSVPHIDTLLRWAGEPASVGPPRALLVLAADELDGVSPELRRRSSGVVPATLPWPGRSEDRGRYIAAAVASTGSGAVDLQHTRLSHDGSRARDPLPFSAEHLSRVIHATAGLNYTGIEACFLQSLKEGATEPEPALRTLRGVRADLLRSESQGLLELEELDAVMPPPLAGDGQRLLGELNWVVDAMAAEATDPRQALLPMGILFVGVPGTGKSLVARHLAMACQHRADVHFVRLGDFRDMWVGSTERNFARILRLLGSFGRAIIFMDEIDQTEGGSRTAERHETSRRVFGRLLQFMADDRNRGRLLWIAATNRPDLLDAALVRPGRFDSVVSFLPPDPEGCLAILRAHLGTCPLKSLVSEDEFVSLAQAMSTQRLVGSEIQLIVTEAARSAVRRHPPVLTGEVLAATLLRFDDSYKSVGDYSRMAEACQKFVRFGPEERA